MRIQHMGVDVGRLAGLIALALVGSLSLTTKVAYAGSRMLSARGHVARTCEPLFVGAGGMRRPTIDRAESATRHLLHTTRGTLHDLPVHACQR